MTEADPPRISVRDGEAFIENPWPRFFRVSNGLLEMAPTKHMKREPPNAILFEVSNGWARYALGARDQHDCWACVFIEGEPSNEAKQ